jgi:hypothetical protein
VTRAISGHATDTMQHHYSSVGAAEKQHAIAKVIELAGVRKALGIASPQDGALGGAHGPETKKPPGDDARRSLFSRLFFVGARGFEPPTPTVSR